MVKYTHLIPENIAPAGAHSIAVYKDTEKVCDIPLGRFTRPDGGKILSFGVFSDTHLDRIQTDWDADEKLDHALSYLESHGCSFAAHCGDLVNAGFYKKADGVNRYDPGQFDAYNTVREKHSIPIYGICGNHESYFQAITDNLPELKEYTGCDLYFSVEQGGCLFVFVGQPNGSTPMSRDALQWLCETLEANRNKRCFVFVHPDLSSGNPLGVYASNRLFEGWKHTAVFQRLLSHYKNTLLFHGHSHMMFECQEDDVAANYTERDGFRSIHVPSLSRPCAIVGGKREKQDDKSYGYIVDVYDDCIVLNGIDFVKSEPVPLGTYKINTPLQAVEAGTFTDSTCVIVT